MSLSGNLGFVALDEVLRLLSRSNQQGAVDVRGDGTHGRIFVGKRGIDLATTLDDEELRRHIAHTGLVDEDHLRDVEGGRGTLASGEEDTRIVELLREMTVESIYQLNDRGSHFEVYEHRTTPFASPKPFELEETLSSVRRRADDWKTVSRTVPDLGMTVDFNRDVGDREEIKVGGDAWKVLTEIRAGASVTQIADRLGTTDFWAARTVADLVGKDLVTLTNGATTTADTAEIADTTERAGYEAGGGWDDGEEPETADAEVGYTGPYDTPAKAREDEDTEDEYPEDGEREETEAETGAPHNESWWEEPAAKDGAKDADVEEDTEAFLEKVFSELEETEDEQEGHGLLRRRRLGALRDLTGES